MKILNVLALFLLFSFHANAKEKIYCQSEKAIINGSKKIDVNNQDFFLIKVSFKEFKLHFSNAMKVYNPVVCNSDDVFIYCNLSNKDGSTQITINRADGKYTQLMDTKDSKSNMIIMESTTSGACYGADKILF